MGLVEHRARPGSSLEDIGQNRYGDEQRWWILAEEAGFELVSRSPINQNPQIWRPSARVCGVCAQSLRWRHGKTELAIMGMAEDRRRVVV